MTATIVTGKMFAIAVGPCPERDAKWFWVSCRSCRQRQDLWASLSRRERVAPAEGVLVPSAPHSATTNTTVFTLTRGELVQVTNKIDMCRRQRVERVLSWVPMFASVFKPSADKDERVWRAKRERLVDSFSVKTYVNNQNILRQGQKGSTFTLLIVVLLMCLWLSQ